MLLLLAGAIFFLTFTFDPQLVWVGALRAFSEAAMVGALADWFAVTALFRHPLGLPIPHTAIVPKNKDRIGRSLGLFIERNFLGSDTLSAQHFSMAKPMAEWLSKGENRAFVLTRIRGVLPQILGSLGDEHIRALLKDTLVKELSNVDIAKVAARFLEILTLHDLHEVLLDEAMLLSSEFFKRNKPWIREKVREASPWFIPDFIDNRIFESIAQKTEGTLYDALSNRKHELRLKVHESMKDFIVNLKVDPGYSERAAHIRNVLLGNEVFAQYFASLRDAIVHAVKDDLTAGSSRILQTVDSILEKTATLILNDLAFQAKAERAVHELVGVIVGAHRRDIADTIARTVESWDAKTLVARLEEEVGSDLQYIRINGTLVGGCVGLVLYFLTTFLI